MKIFIYTEGLKIEAEINQKEELLKQVQALDEQIKIRTTIITNILKGILIEKNYFNQNLELPNLAIENIKINLTNKRIEKTKKGLSSLNLIEGEQNLPNFRKRKNGVWEGRQLKNGIYYSAYSKDLKKCKQKLKEKLNNTIKNNTHNISVKEWFTKYIENYKKNNVKPKTYEFIQNIINHIINLFNNILLKNLTAELIQEKISKLKPCRTTNLICTYLNAGLEKALQLDYINKNPYKATEIKKAKENKGHAFKYNEQIKIIENIKGKDIEPLFYVYVLTGIRANEIFNIVEINEDKNYIKVIREKSDNKIKTIMVTNETIKIIKSINIKKVNTKTFYKKFKDLLKELNIDGNVHSLRHTYATNNYYLKTPIKHLQEFIGHEDISLTYNVYTDFDEDLSKEKIIKLYNNLYYIFD